MHILLEIMVEFSGQRTGWLVQRVLVNEVQSSLHLVTSGVLQSSVVGPVVFCVLISELTEETSRTCRQDDVVDIEQQLGRVRALMIDEERGVRAGREEPKMVEEHCDALVPSVQSLLESVQGPQKQAHVI